MTPFLAVLRVVKVLPQVQRTSVSTYSGWMSLFTRTAPSVEVAGSCRHGTGAREPEPPSVCQTHNQAPDAVIPVLTCCGVAQLMRLRWSKRAASAEHRRTG